MHPSGRLGSVIHKLLEDAGRGLFAPPDTRRIEERWGELICSTEEGMMNSELERFFVPLRASVNSYEVRRIQAIMRAQEIAENMTRRATVAKKEDPGNLLGCEVPVASADGLVRGRIDVVLASRHGPVLRDYKSGSIFEKGTKRLAQLKEAYETQLRIYAGLYFHTTGAWPSKLEVIPLFGPPQEVAFDKEGCHRLVEEARSILRETNEVLEEAKGSPLRLQERLAQPSPKICSFCLFRPACSPYLILPRKEAVWPKDISGSVEKVSRLGNKKFMIMLRNADNVITIRGLTPPPRHQALEELICGDEIAIYSLRRCGSDITFIETPFTTIYFQPMSEGGRAGAELLNIKGSNLGN